MKKKQNIDYRDVWIDHYGEIPVDSDGRTYEIHHIDGNRENNDITNLIALSLDDHYSIHKLQGDYSACLLMSVQRMNRTPEQISDDARQSILKRMSEGTAPFQDPDFLKRKSEEMRAIQLDLAAAGSHNFQNPEFIQQHRQRIIDYQLSLVNENKHLFQTVEHQNKVKKVNEERLTKGTHNFQDREWASQRAFKRVEDGTHHFVGGQVQRELASRLLSSGEHHLQTNNPNKMRVSCVVCRKETSIPCLNRDHKHQG